MLVTLVDGIASFRFGYNSRFMATARQVEAVAREVLCPATVGGPVVSFLLERDSGHNVSYPCPLLYDYSSKFT